MSTMSLRDWELTKDFVYDHLTGGFVARVIEDDPHVLVRMSILDLKRLSVCGVGQYLLIDGETLRCLEFGVRSNVHPVRHKDNDAVLGLLATRHANGADPRRIGEEIPEGAWQQYLGWIRAERQVILDSVSDQPLPGICHRRTLGDLVRDGLLMATGIGALQNIIRSWSRAG